LPAIGRQDGAISIVTAIPLALMIGTG